ncbi:suppressor of rasval19 [Friedmanniomyces endolithicus]|nr:suppressor of rasval19 [Friedmanniomyces endolithicus]
MSRPASIANVAVRKNITAPVTIAADNPLTTLIHRLEAATSRLEDIASSAASFEHSDSSTPIPSGGPASSSAPELPALVERASQAHMPKAEPLPPAISDMDELIDTDVRAFVDASKGLDQALEEQAQSVAKAFADQRRFILVSTKAKKPDMQSPETFSVLLKDLQHDLGSVGDIKDSNRGSPVKEHLAMVAEGTGALQWLLMEGKPADYVAETIGGAQMYGNRVLTKYKEKDQTQVKYNYDSPSEPLEVEVSLTQSLLISKCKNTTIVLKGKANAISIDNCPRLQILVDTLVSSVDVIKSPNFAVQITGKVPTVLLDQVDGGSIYLGRESLGTEVFTSKCSSVNVVLPPLESEEEGDSREVPLPEQMRTVVRGGRLVSEIVEHAG